MRSPKKTTGRTPESLLAAASEVFAEVGYHRATVAEICRRAGANVAAVNYHFGDKQNLYAQSWRHCFSQSLEAHPPDGGVSDAAPAEERLRGHIRALLARITDPANREFLIVQKELANPTGLLDEAIRGAMLPQRLRLLALVRELLGPAVPEPRVRFCVASIVSLCIDPVAMRIGPARRMTGRDGPLQAGEVEAYCRHIEEFALAGVRAVARDATEPGREVSEQRAIQGGDDNAS